MWSLDLGQHGGLRVDPICNQDLEYKKTEKGKRNSRNNLYEDTG